MTDRLSRLTAALADRYAVERELGSGGMATVYLAEDPKHRRKVAIKVMKPELAQAVGADRFLREIETAANLTHPHILPVHDSGEADGLLYYVMPHVEGESLRKRLDREKQLPLAEAVAIASAVARALDYAHRQGVVHRDVKPANILLHEGQALVADFGIAIAMDAVESGRLTGTGLSPGTPQYMSPEQATADRPVDGRSDIYSLGCMLYEMLAGEPPHSGPTVQAVIGKMLTDRPRLVTELRGTVPEQVAAAVHKALAKLPADRFGTAAEMDDVLSGRVPLTLAEVAGGPLPASAVGGGLGMRLVPWALAGVFLALLVLLPRGQRQEGFAGPRYLNITLPDTIPLVYVGEAWGGIAQTALDLSPDGRYLAYVGPADTTTRLYLRELDGGFETRALRGTEGALSPFFSPDGEWIGFAAHNQLMRVSLDGEQTSPIAEANEPYGVDWSEGDRIVTVTQDGESVVFTGPTGEDAVRRSLGTTYMSQPRWLPGGEWILGMCYAPGYALCVTSAETLESRPLILDGEAGDPAGIVLNGTNPRYVPGGYLVYSDAEGNVVKGVRFDPASLTVTGPPVELLRDVRRENFHGVLQLSLSDAGDVVYAPGANAIRGRFVWASRDGALNTLPFPPRVYGGFRLSPDGRRVAADVTTGLDEDETWMLDLVQQRESRLSLSRTDTLTDLAGWLPDSRTLIAGAWDTDSSQVFQVDALRAGSGTVLWKGAGVAWPNYLTPDGHLLLTISGETNHIARVPLSSLGELPANASEAFLPIIELPGNQGMPDQSPDGTWLTYLSTESGPHELYAVRLGTDEPPYRLSNGGSEWSLWSPRGDGIYQRDGQSYYWIALTGDPDQPFADPVLFAEGNFLNVPGLEMAVHPDGDRLLLLEGSAERTTTQLNLIVNWVEVLRERLGG